MYTKTDIVNMALVRLSLPTVSEVSDNPDAELFYEHVVRKLLECYQWNWAVTYDCLPLLDESPKGGYEKAYLFPTAPCEALRILLAGPDAQGECNCDQLYHCEQDGWEIRNLVRDNCGEKEKIKAIVTNYGAPLHVAYIARVDEDMFSDLFVEMVYLKLAIELSAKYVSSTQTHQTLTADLARATKKAKRIDALQSTNKPKKYAGVKEPLFRRGGF